MTAPDPGILEDFLTEAGELIEQIDIELVELEAATGDRAGELLDSIFRALHTVKGAAGFIGLDSVTTFAHAAEDALNRLRKEAEGVEQETIDALLRSADVLRGQVEDLNAGDAARACPDDLLASLRAIADGGGAAPGEAPDEAGGDPAGPFAGLDTRELELDASKAELLEFMAADLRQAATEVAGALDGMKEGAGPERVRSTLISVAEGVARAAEFFEFEDLAETAALLTRGAGALATLEGDAFDQLVLRLRAMGLMIGVQGELLENGRAPCWAIDTLADRIEQLIEGEDPTEMSAGVGDPAAALAADGVIQAALVETAPGAADESDTAAGPDPAGPRGEEGDRKAASERTIRVDVHRLEELLNLVGQLVLTKNQVMGVARRMSESESGSDMTDEMGAVAGELDLVTASLQTAVTRTRLQPLAKLFDRYPRVIRDMARLTDKRIRLEIEGRETEVDKSVLELLGDPLVHILRNSADHGVEPPDQRAEAGKPETGTIRLIAEHQGSHVRIAIEDDGRGIDRAVIGRKAVDKGLASEDQIAAMSDDEVLQFIFAPGFSTASEVSDLSGRGVGMDVVRTNVRRMNGSIGVQSTPGRGSTIEILIPLTIAIMPALEVEVGAERYCLPLQSVVEIVRPQEDLSHTVDRRPVMRLRGTVLPLIELRDTLAVDGERVGEGFAVVVHAGRQRAGLVVDRLIGQKEIVIKPLDRDAAGGGPFSGATIQEDGRVSLILDVNGILQCGLDGDDTKHVKAA